MVYDSLYSYETSFNIFFLLQKRPLKKGILERFAKKNRTMSQVLHEIETAPIRILDQIDIKLMMNWTENYLKELIRSLNFEHSSNLVTKHINMQYIVVFCISLLVIPCESHQ